MSSADRGDALGSGSEFSRSYFERAMKRVFTWPTVCLAVALVLIAAAFALMTGNDGVAVALFVVAFCEGIFGAALVLFANRRMSRSV